jgi:hypothetical protein
VKVSANKIPISPDSEHAPIQRPGAPAEHSGALRT